MAASSSVDVAAVAPMMPTHAQLAAASKNIEFPFALTNGVPTTEFGKYGLVWCEKIQKLQLNLDHFPKYDGCGSIETAITSLERTYRLVNEYTSGDLVKDAKARPYTKVRYHINSRNLFLLLFICICCVCVCCCCCCCCCCSFRMCLVYMLMFCISLIIM